MFIAINLDLASHDSQSEIIRVLNEYGITKISSSLYESLNFPAKKLGSLKRDMTKCIDMYDRIRIYQYPLDDVFKISFVENRKWKRLSITK